MPSEFPPSATLTLILVMMLAATHLASPTLAFLDRTPRSVWLSLAGGISIAYVILHLLPELAERQHKAASETLLYQFALLGLTLFYGLEKVTRRRVCHERAAAADMAFWLHIIPFAIYNFLVGYLLEEEARREGFAGVTVYTIAMALHFLVNDRALYARHTSAYLQLGRWLIAAGTFAGWLCGLLFDISQAWISCIFAFLAGGVILNVLKEELPEERESRFWAFAAGAAFYAALLAALWQL